LHGRAVRGDAPRRCGRSGCRGRRVPDLLLDFAERPPTAETVAPDERALARLAGPDQLEQLLAADRALRHVVGAQIKPLVLVGHDSLLVIAAIFGD
jgi:hypothetical protein